jgi:hypothetical protein
MDTLFSSTFAPDPSSARDVLAFVLCPLTVFAPSGDAEELEAIAELIAPARAEAVQRWYDARAAATLN